MVHPVLQGESRLSGPSSCASSCRSPQRTAACLTCARSPANRCSAVRHPPLRVAQPNQTSPTGLAALPPPGPAIPVTAIATSAALWLSAPLAIAAATSELTAPQRWISCDGTPSRRAFDSLLYVTQPHSNQCELPGIAVKACAIPPPVQDSAEHSRHPRSRRTFAMASAAHVMASTIVSLCWICSPSDS